MILALLVGCTAPEPTPSRASAPEVIAPSGSALPVQEPLRLLASIPGVDGVAPLADGHVLAMRRPRDLSPGRLTVHAERGPEARWDVPWSAVDGRPSGPASVGPAGDLDQDGAPDVIFGQAVARGSGTWASLVVRHIGSTAPEEDQPSLLTLAVDERTRALSFVGPVDLGGDGAPDVLIVPMTGGEQALAWYWLRAASGGPILDPEPVLLEGGAGLHGGPVAAFGDIDGDGIVDLAVTSPRRRTLAIHLGVRDSSLQPTPDSVHQAGEPGFGAAIAIAQDGRTLVASGPSVQGPWSGAWLTRDGQLSPPDVPLCPDRGPVALAALGPTLVVACTTAHGLSIHELLEEGTSSPPITVVTPPPSALRMETWGAVVAVIGEASAGPGHVWLFGRAGYAQDGR